MRLTGAARRPDGTLAPSSRTAVTRRSGEAGYDDVDLEAVAGHLQQIGSGPEEARFEVPVPRIRLIMVAEDGLGPIDIDEVHQHYLWPVTGTDGCRHLLSMEVGGREMQMVSDVRSRELQVCAITVEDCRPTGIFVREYDRICLLTATYPPSRSVSNLGFRRQRRRKEQIQRRTPTQAPDKIATDRSPMQVLAQDVHEALTALAASGTMRPTGMVSHVLRTRARLADDLQLTTLAAALNELDSRPSPGAVLLACAVVDRIDALTR